MKNIPTISVGDTLELKKPHPCGCKRFKVTRIGSDIRISCMGCGHPLTIERVKIEKMIKNIVSGGNNDE